MPSISSSMYSAAYAARKMRKPFFGNPNEEYARATRRVKDRGLMGDFGGQTPN
jgi:hypothetical protein